MSPGFDISSIVAATHNAARFSQPQDGTYHRFAIENAAQHVQKKADELADSVELSDAAHKIRRKQDHEKDGSQGQHHHHHDESAGYDAIGRKKPGDDDDDGLPHLNVAV